jgi:hypothetical protein
MEGMRRFDEMVRLWREVSAEPRYHVAVVRARRSHEKAVKRYEQRLAHLQSAVGSRLVVGGASGVAGAGFAVAESFMAAGALLATGVAFGLGSWQARRELETIQPPSPPMLPPRPGTRAAELQAQLDTLAKRRERLAGCLPDDHAAEALQSAAEAEELLRAAVGRMAALDETAVGAPDSATAEVVAELEAEVVGGLESYEVVLAHGVQLAGVASTGGVAVAALEDAAEALEARTYGLRRLGEVGLR